MVTSMTTTTATAHLVEQTHDARYYELLMELGAARTAVRIAADRMALKAATIRGARNYSGVIEYRLGDTRGEIITPTAGDLVRFSVKGSPVVKTYTGRDLRDATAADAIAAGADRTGYDAALAGVDAVLAKIDAHEVAYTGWTRYMIVTSSAGHVHASTECSTCRLTTTFAPVVSLSGTDSTEAIAALGETLCSVCFPDAPIAGKVGKISVSAAKKILAA